VRLHVRLALQQTEASRLGETIAYLGPIWLAN
jgi:hypothetical protein